MFAFLMRAPHWRGWTRGSRRTPSDPRCAGTSSADPTRGRYGGMWRPRCGTTCRRSGSGTTSTRWNTDRWRRATTSGRRTAARRSSTSERPTGAGGPTPRRGASGGPTPSWPRAGRRNGARELQVAAPTSVRTRGCIPTKMMIKKKNMMMMKMMMKTSRAARGVGRRKPRTRRGGDPEGPGTVQRSSEKNNNKKNNPPWQSEETCCWVVVFFSPSSSSDRRRRRRK